MDTAESVIARFAQYYEANPEAARAARDELQTKGSLPDHPYRQLGLSVALTPVERRCAHYGDTQVCPFCLSEQTEQARVQKDLEESQRETAEVKSLLRGVLRGDQRAAYIARRRYGYGNDAY